MKEYFKGAIGRSYEKVLFNNKLDPDNKQTICKEVLAHYPVVIYTRKDFFLMAALNEKIGIFKAAGLVEFWHFQNYDGRELTFQEPNSPKRLTTDHLMGCFQTLMFGCAVSLIIFLLELFVRKSQSCISREVL